MQVGNTLLALDCAPDGLASRSRGIIAESDLGWAVRHGARGASDFVRATLRFLIRTFGRLLTSWLAIVAVFILLFLYWPWFHNTVKGGVYSAYFDFVLPQVQRLVRL